MAARIDWSRYEIDWSASARSISRMTGHSQDAVLREKRRRGVARWPCTRRAIAWELFADIVHESDHAAKLALAAELAVNINSVYAVRRSAKRWHPPVESQHG